MQESDAYTHQILDDFHDPFSSTAVGSISDDPNKRELGAYTKHRSLAG